MSRALDRLRKRRQGIGHARLVLYGFVRLLSKLSRGVVEIHYEYVIFQPVPRESLLKGRTGVLELRTLEGADLLLEFDRDQDGAFSRPPKDRPRTERRVERGDLCITAARSSRVLGTLWLSFGTFDETKVRCDFVVSAKDGIAWDSNLYIVEDARGGLIFAALWDCANAAMRERGYRGTATMTSAFNGPSLQSHERLGARRIGRVVFARLGPMQVTFSSLRPHFHLAGPSGKGPVFVIPA